MNKLLATAVISAICLSSAPAMAAVSLNWTTGQVGTQYTVDFNGIIDGNVTPGLTGQVVYKLQSINGNSWLFDYTVNNTSSAPITASRISIFGFNTDPDFNSTTSTGLFSVVGSGNVPQLQFSAEACYKPGGGSNNCAGGGGNGVLIGGSESGTFTLNFGSAQNAITLDSLFVRYQSIDGPGLNGSSGVGVPTSVVPEPASWAMMIVGFGLAGTMIRSARRRHYLAA